MGISMTKELACGETRITLENDGIFWQADVKEATWPDLLEKFFYGLEGLGYVLDRDDGGKVQSIMEIANTYPTFTHHHCSEDEELEEDEQDDDHSTETLGYDGDEDLCVIVDSEADQYKVAYLEPPLHGHVFWINKVDFTKKPRK